jgi:3-deoxy-manno-octulosonate cytidylyltransferase (CMP-KDO synthetase)
VTARALGVIPARWAATRFPGKPLAMLWGRPMLRHVWERSRAIPALDALIVATDDVRIAEAARGWGAEVAMTSPACASGTDRVAEVAGAHADAEIVLNLQGDEPELDGDAVGRMLAGMRELPAIRMATLAHAEEHPGRLASLDVVKVVVDLAGDALYFSRVDIGAGTVGGPALRHVGVYGFRRDTLFAFASWPPGVLEKAERLEQLRALERGVKIRVFTGTRPFSGVDTPEQMAALEARGPR